MSEMMMISVPMDDYEEKAKDQRTLEIMRDMLVKKGMIYTETLHTLLGVAEKAEEKTEDAKDGRTAD